MKLADIKVGKHYWFQGGIWECIGIHPSVPKSPRLRCKWPQRGQEKLADARQVEREASERELASMGDFA
jgi:hypothetical protein